MTEKKITTLDDLFDQEERQKQIEHEAWLNDPVAQAAWAKQMEANRLRAEREAGPALTDQERIDFLRSQIEDLQNEHDGSPETQQEIEDLEGEIADISANMETGHKDDPDADAYYAGEPGQ